MMTETPKPQKQAPQEEKKSSFYKKSTIGVAILAAGMSALLFAHQPTKSPPQTQTNISKNIQASEIPSLALNMNLLSPNNAEKAIMASSMPSQTKTQMLSLLKDNKIRMAVLPVSDSMKRVGQILELTTAGITQTVALTPNFQEVLLPIDNQGEVIFHWIPQNKAETLSVLSVDTYHMVTSLPPMTPLQSKLSVSVILQ